jgi:5-methylcytosine-specific restriction endonuclease McrA
MEELLSDLERRELRLKARAAVLSSLEALGGTAARGPLLEHARANGGFRPRELAALAPASAKHELMLDHELSWALTNLRRDGLVANPQRSLWALAGAALETDPPAVEVVPDEVRLTELRSMPYREYLRSPEWRRTRAAALHRAGSQCSFDATHPGPLHVHHRTYERLGSELAADLLVVCEECHRVHHAYHGRPSNEARKAARRKAKREAAFRDLAFRLGAVAVLVAGLVGMLGR